MKYSLFLIVILVSLLSACGEPKPGQYPPSQNILQDRDKANQE